jgi:hypothetical protein
MKTATHPFQFATATYLTRILNQKANNLREFCLGLESCSDASIFYHTFQSLNRYHFLAEAFSSDFAQWAVGACNRADLAEQLAALDIRDYFSLADLRGDLHRAVSDYCRTHPQYVEQTSFEPFFFLESIEVAMSLGFEARTLEEFRDGVRRLTHASLHYHFITSRLRLHLRTNDFSLWLADNLGLGTLAERANRIDIYTNTLESVHAILLDQIEEELAR